MPVFLDTSCMYARTISEHYARISGREKWMRTEIYFSTIDGKSAGIHSTTKGNTKPTHTYGRMPCVYVVANACSNSTVRQTTKLAFIFRRVHSWLLATARGSHLAPFYLI